MGQSSSRPESLPFPYLSHYQPFLQSPFSPGRPLHLKQSSSSAPDTFLQAHPFIDCYQLHLELSDRHYQRQQQIYENRKSSLSCLVQILHYQAEREQCECSSSNIKLLVYTQHIPLRLVNFKIVNSHHPSDSESLHSLNLDQAIYIIVNALHGYQLLSQQYSLNYPTPHSIGISLRGTVKLWINQNFASNQESLRKIPEGSLIQEIIHLVQERTQGSLSEILKQVNGLETPSFSTMQQVLGKWVINFQKGRKSIQNRLAQIHMNITNKITQKVSVSRPKVNLSPAKHPLPQPPPSNPPPQIYQIINRPPQLPQTNDPPHQLRRRSMSLQQTKRHQAQQIPPQQNYSVRKSTPPKTAQKFQSPKKPVKFIYQQREENISPINRISLHFNQPVTTPFNKPPTVSFTHKPRRQQVTVHTSQLSNSFSKQSQTKTPSSPSQFSRTHKQAKFQEDLIAKKLNLEPERGMILVHRTLPNLKTSLSTANNRKHQQKGESRPSKQYPSHDSYGSPLQNSNRPHTGLSEPFQLDYLQKSPPRITLNVQSRIQYSNNRSSLLEITEQFKMLLQSQKCISDEEMPLSHSLQESTGHDAIRVFSEELNIKSFQTHHKESLMGHIEAIKEEDQDICYSLEEIL